MKIYTKVILDWNSATKQYEETYAETYDYKGEVALCQRVGYTGPDLNTVIDTIFSGLESEKEGKEVKRQFDESLALSQKKLEQGDRELDIRNKTADASVKSAENAGIQLDMALTRQDIDADTNTMMVFEGMIPVTQGQWDAKVAFGKSLLESNTIHESLLARLQQSVIRAEQGSDSHRTYTGIMTDPDVTSDDLRAIARTGVTKDGIQLILNPTQKRSALSMAEDMEMHAVRNQYTNSVKEQLRGMGYSDENPQWSAIMSSIKVGNYPLASKKFKELGGDITLVQANEGMATILEDNPMEVQPDWGLKQTQDALREVGGTSADINLFGIYWNRAESLLPPLSAAETGPYSKEDFPKIRAFIIDEYKKLVESGAKDKNTGRPLQPMTFTDAQIAEVAQSTGLIIDENNNIIHGETKPVRISVQDVKPGSTYIVKTDQPFYKKDLSKAPLQIVHSNNMEGEIIVDRIGQPRGMGPGMEAPEPHVFFRDSKTKASYDIPISYFKKYFVETKRSR